MLLDVAGEGVMEAINMTAVTSASVVPPERESANGKQAARFGDMLRGSVAPAPREKAKRPEEMKAAKSAKGVKHAAKSNSAQAPERQADTAPSGTSQAAAAPAVTGASAVLVPPAEEEAPVLIHGSEPASELKGTPAVSKAEPTANQVPATTPDLGEQVPIPDALASAIVVAGDALAEKKLPGSDAFALAAIAPVMAAMAQVSLGFVGVHGARRIAEPEAASVPEASSKPEEGRVIEASAGALEVGLATGTHGWLRVRAELGEGGTVLAQVVARAGAAESLHKDLPAISAYLAHEQVGVSSLVVHAMEAAAPASDALSRSASGGSDPSQTDSDKAGEDAEQKAGMNAEAVQAGTAPETGPGSDHSMLPGALLRNRFNGGWLSVRV